MKWEFQGFIICAERTFKYFQWSLSKKKTIPNVFILRKTVWVFKFYMWNDLSLVIHSLEWKYSHPSLPHWCYLPLEDVGFCPPWPPPSPSSPFPSQPSLVSGLTEVLCTCPVTSWGWVCVCDVGRDDSMQCLQMQQMKKMKLSYLNMFRQLMRL